jgi:cyclic pyranopterin phosphate synthase
MVDVGAKAVTLREASAEAIVTLPRAAALALRRAGQRTAIVAGAMAAKRTHELIPFCHPLAIERCKISIEETRVGRIVLRCEVAIHGRTGVEMEALTGVTVAALTIYDMTKALSHDIRLSAVRLLAKSGGKRDFRRTRR